MFPLLVALFIDMHDFSFFHLKLMRFSQSTHQLTYLSLFVFCYDKDLLTYSGRTDRPCELCYNFSISNLKGSLTVTLTVTFGFLSSNACICSTIAFPPLGNSDHVVVSVSIDFIINSKQDALFYCVV